MKKTYVLDTNVLIHDPDCVYKFEDNDVIIPIVVVEELDKLKKGQGEISYSSRHALRMIDSLREQGNLSKGIRLHSGGRFQVMLDKDYNINVHNTADNRIIAVADALHKHSNDPVILVSKDTGVRIKAEALGLDVQDYRNDKTTVFQQYGKIMQDDDYHNGITSVRYQKIGDEFFRLTGTDKRETAQKYPSVLGITPKNQEQQCAFDALISDKIDVVALTGKAGTGKTLLALAAGIYLCEKSMGGERQKQRGEEDRSARNFEQVIVARPVIPMGHDIGYLPGDVEEKLNPWMQPIYDNLDVIISTPIDKKDNKTVSKYKNSHYIVESGLIHIEPLTYIRGRSLPKRFIIIDESQNLRPLDVKTIITRCGEGTKIVFTGDLYQIDTPYLDISSNGLAYLISRFIQEENFCYLNLTTSARSRLAERAAELL